MFIHKARRRGRRIERIIVVADWTCDFPKSGSGDFTNVSRITAFVPPGCSSNGNHRMPANNHRSNSIYNLAPTLLIHDEKSTAKRFRITSHSCDWWIGPWTRILVYMILEQFSLAPWELNRMGIINAKTKKKRCNKIHLAFEIHFHVCVRFQSRTHTFLIIYFFLNFIGIVCLCVCVCHLNKLNWIFYGMVY